MNEEFAIVDDNFEDDIKRLRADNKALRGDIKDLTGDLKLARATIAELRFNDNDKAKAVAGIELNNSNVLADIYKVFYKYRFEQITVKELTQYTGYKQTPLIAAIRTDKAFTYSTRTRLITFIGDRFDD